MTTYKCILVGGTGTVGQQVLKNLLDSSKCQKILAIGRSPLPAQLLKHPNYRKLEYLKLSSIDQLKDKSLLNQMMKRKNIENYEVGLWMAGKRFPLQETEKEASNFELDQLKNFIHFCNSKNVSCFGYLSYLHASRASNGFLAKVKGMAEDQIRHQEQLKKIVFDFTDYFSFS